MPLPPGPALPRILQTILFGWVPQRFLLSNRARFGPAFTIRLTGRDMILFSAPEAVRQIFSDPEQRLRMSDYNRIVEPIVESESLLLLDDARHEHQRKLLMESFRRSRLQALFGPMEAICTDHLSRLRPGQRITAFDLYERITLEVILGVLLGPQSPDALARLRSTMEPVTNMSLFLLLIPALRRDLGPLSPGRRFIRGRARLSAALNELIAERRAALERGDSPPGMLTELVAIRDEQGQPMSDLTLRSVMMSVIVAGHETTAAALAWGLIFLLNDAEAAGRLEAELDSVTSPEELSELPWLDAVCREALRISPIFPAVPRTTREPQQIGGHALPGGVEVSCCAYFSHRDPQVFEEPERFNPERFLNKKYSPYSYYPFGGGSRMCIGWAFGLGQMKVLLAATMRQMKLKALDSRPQAGQWRQITWIPRRGGRVEVLGPRDPSSDPAKQQFD